METSLLTTNGYSVSQISSLENITPAAYGTKPAEARTNRYSFLPTNELINTLVELGWEPKFAQQNGRSVYSRHFIKFEHPNLSAIKIGDDEIVPQAILDNSHDGTTVCAIHMGLFRSVCSNGLVVAIPGMSSTFTFKHIGIDKNQIKELMEQINEHFIFVAHQVKKMQNITLTQNQRIELTVKAIAAREPNRYMDNGEIKVQNIIETNDINEILNAIRPDDEGNDLWRTFNVIQEKLVKGGYNRTAPSGRNTKARGISNAARNFEFNKTLWSLAEEYFNVKRSLPQRDSKGRFIKRK